MVIYRIEWKHSAVKELRKLPKEVVPKILKSVEELAENPYPKGTRKLVGSELRKPVRVGIYRIIYSVFESVCVVEIVRVGHRKDIYQK